MQYDCVVGDDVAVQKMKHERCRGGPRELGAVKGYLSYWGVIAAIFELAGVLKPISRFFLGEVVVRPGRTVGVNLLQPAAKPAVDVIGVAPITRQASD